MTVADIQKVPMPAADAGSALIAGKVPVAVTYEPYLTLAMQQSPKVKMIYSAGENPGLISDVFVVREEFLKDKPGQIVALLKAWDLALADYRKDTAGGRAIISQAVGAKPEELATAFGGVVYYSIAENKSELNGSFAQKVIPEVHAAARKANILQKDVDLTRRSTVALWMRQRNSRQGTRRLFRLGGRMTAAEYLAIATAVFAALGIAWYGFTASGMIRPLFLPSPGQVINRLRELWSTGQLAADAGISIYRIGIGFLISTVIALPIGVLIGCYRAWGGGNRGPSSTSSVTCRSSPSCRSPSCGPAPAMPRSS